MPTRDADDGPEREGAPPAEGESLSDGEMERIAEQLRARIRERFRRALDQDTATVSSGTRSDDGSDGDDGAFDS